MLPSDSTPQSSPAQDLLQAARIRLMFFCSCRWSAGGASSWFRGMR